MPLVTPDGRCIVVRGRLWRCANPNVNPAEKRRLVKKLMAARLAVFAAQKSNDREALKRARAAVQRAKVGLGERGPVWWCDGEPDQNRHLIENTAYRDWFDSVQEAK